MNTVERAKMQARKNHYYDDGSTGLAGRRSLAVFIRGHFYLSRALGSGNEDRSLTVAARIRSA